jgi:hypothetical protein
MLYQGKYRRDPGRHDRERSGEVEGVQTGAHPVENPLTDFLRGPAQDKSRPPFRPLTAQMTYHGSRHDRSPFSTSITIRYCKLRANTVFS